MPSNRTPRALTIALTTGSALIVGLELAARVEHAQRWALHGAALAVLAILAVIVAAANGRPEDDRRQG